MGKGPLNKNKWITFFPLLLSARVTNVVFCCISVTYI